VKASFKQVLGVVACVLFLGGSVNAGVLYDNLPAVTDGVDPIVGFGPLADSFSTGATAVGLTNVSVRLTNGGSPGTGNIMVSLAPDTGGGPSMLQTLLGTISDSMITSGLTVFDLPQGSPVMLSASTRYWIVLASSDGSTAGWGWSLDTSGPGVAGEFFFNQNGVFPNSDGPYQMAINRSLSTPEPSTLVGASLGVLLGLAALRRKRA
jgi:hypothetical protein